VRPSNPPQSQREKLALRISKLQSRAQQLEQISKQRERRRQVHARIVAGAILLDHPELFGLSGASVNAVLDAHVKRAHDRSALLLDELVE